MRKEIEAMKNLIAAMDAEEKTRHRVEREGEWFYRSQMGTIITGPVTLPEALTKAIEDHVQASSDLAAARGIAKYLIREAEQSEPRDDENGPAARLPT